MAWMPNLENSCRASVLWSVFMLERWLERWLERI